MAVFIFVRLLREIAGRFAPDSSNLGRASFAQGSFQLHPQNKEKEEIFRQKLLHAAEHLDSLPGKVIGKKYDHLEDEKHLDLMLPKYFVDPFRIAQESNANMLTDDALLTQSYKVTGETLIPNNFSSLSLMRSLADRRKIKWETYLEYFSFLSSYRYHLLPISIEDLLRSIFPSASEGLVTFTPKNILYLNLKLTLSEEYGVNETVAANILSEFFSKIILDDSIPPEAAEEIYKITILESLEKRDKRSITNTIYLLCKKNMISDEWSSRLSKEKLHILNKQLSQYTKEYSPIIIETSIMNLGSHKKTPFQ